MKDTLIVLAVFYLIGVALTAISNLALAADAPTAPHDERVRAWRRLKWAPLWPWLAFKTLRRLHRELAPQRKGDTE